MVSVLHRLRAAAAMDQVAVISDGRVVELGHHNALLAEGGLYANFWHRQMSGFDISASHRVRITADRLASIPLFHGVEKAVLRWLAAEFVSERVRPGEEVFREGDPPDSFYVVVAGTLEVLQDDLWGGVPIKQGVVEEGDFFGDAGLLEDRPRAVTVRARGEGLLLRLDRDRFLDLLERDPDYRRFFNHSPGQRLAVRRQAKAFGSAARPRSWSPLHHPGLPLQWLAARGAAQQAAAATGVVDGGLDLIGPNLLVPTTGPTLLGTQRLHKAVGLHLGGPSHRMQAIAKG